MSKQQHLHTYLPKNICFVKKSSFNSRNLQSLFCEKTFILFLRSFFLFRDILENLKMKTLSANKKWALIFSKKVIYRRFHYVMVETFQKFEKIY